MNMGWNSKFRESKPVRIEGREFDSHRAAAAHYNCDPKSIAKLVRIHGDDIEKFELDKPKKGVKVEYMGKIYRSIREAARKNNVSQHRVRNYAQKNPM